MASPAVSPFAPSLSFLDRLTWILGDRTPHGWAKRLGWDHSVMNRIRTQDNVPGPRYLEQIALVENTSVSWLLAGVGPPFLVYQHATPQEALDALTERVRDRALRLLVVRSGDRLALAMARTAFLQGGKGEVGFQAVELHTGTLDEHCLEIVPSLAMEGRAGELEVPDEDFSRLVQGLVGAWELTGAEEAIHPESWFGCARPLTEPNRVLDYASRYAHDGLDATERRLVNRFRSFSANLRRALLQVIESMREDR